MFILFVIEDFRLDMEILIKYYRLGDYLRSNINNEFQ